jgi:hypothetical protein
MSKLTAWEGPDYKLYKDELIKAHETQKGTWRANTCIKFKSKLPDLVCTEVCDASEAISSGHVRNMKYDIRFCFARDDVKFICVLRYRKSIEDELKDAKDKKALEERKRQEEEDAQNAKKEAEVFASTFEEDDIDNIPTTPPKSRHAVV